MTRRAIAATFIYWTAILGFLHFFSDLLGAVLAIGWLFDPSLDGFVLLSMVPVVVLVVTVPLGLTLGLIVPKSWIRPVSVRTKRVGAVLFACWIVVGSYSARQSRQLIAPEGKRGSAVRGSAPVLWIVVDTLRADALYGDELMFELAPELGKFAKDALVFEDAESTAGWTIPATATLMTGIHNLTMDASAGRLPDWAPTAAEHLYSAGYRTHAVVDNVIVEPRAGFGAGFETYFQRSAFRFVFSLPGFRILPQWVQMECRRKLHSFYYGASGVTDQALRLLEGNGDEPLFLYVHYMDPHAPYNHHSELGALPAESEPINYYDWRILLHESESTQQPTNGQQKNLLYRDDNEITLVSREIGRLLDAWHQRYGESGLIMLTSDHGEEFLEHGHYGHGHTVHRESVHVPLLFQFPKGTLSPLRSTGSVRYPVSLIDVLPTTLDALGIEPVLGDKDFPMQGLSMLPLLNGEVPNKSRPLIASHSRHGRRVYRYREEDRVYLRTTFYNGDLWEGFFDLSNDEDEMINLVDSLGTALFEMKTVPAKLDTATKSLWRAHMKLAEKDKTLSEESLRAIGYIQ